MINNKAFAKVFTLENNIQNPILREISTNPAYAKSYGGKSGKVAKLSLKRNPKIKMDSKKGKNKSRRKL